VAEVLIIEDEPALAFQLGRALEDDGHDVRLAGSAGDGLQQARTRAPDLVLLDLRLPDQPGLDVLDRLREQDPELPVVVASAYGSVGDAVRAMRQGAVDYLQKPLDLGSLSLLITRVLEDQRRRRELRYLRERTQQRSEAIVGKDARLLEVFSQVARLRDANLAPGDRPAILLRGETGTGKGLVAHAIHELLGGGPFIELSCAATSADLIERELFGHEHGALSDGGAPQAGLFEAAQGGTILLDEIGELDGSLQAKLVAALKGGRARRLGSSRDRPFDAQVVATTGGDLDAAVRAGRFRSDLLHRLRVLCFDLAPLRERGDDVIDLARHFCREVGARYGRPEVDLAAGAEKHLRAYAWPGNVRELRNVIERALLLHREEELPAEAFADLSELARHDLPTGADPLAPRDGVPGLADVERTLITEALARTGGNRTRAAQQLGLSRYTLRYRMKKWGLD
jgi:two-component system response regulator AtoC